jgi:thiamine biosynthesis protein ThiS
MEIEIKLWGGIAYYSPEGRGKFSLKRHLEKEATVQEVVEGLQLPKDLRFVIAVNGEVIESEYGLKEYVLKDGDEVALFTPSSGG